MRLIKPKIETTKAGNKTARKIDAPETIEILPNNLLDRSKQKARTKEIMILWLDFSSRIGPKIKLKDNNNKENVTKG